MARDEDASDKGFEAVRRKKGIEPRESLFE